MGSVRFFWAVLAVVLGWTWDVEAGQSKAVYPGKRWEARTPGEAGVDGRKLTELSDYAGGFGCVVRGGYMVYTWGDVSKRKDVASAVKRMGS